MSENEVVAWFHSLYYGSRVWQNTFWMGVAADKCQPDLRVYQELIFEVQPDVIILALILAASGLALWLKRIDMSL